LISDINRQDTHITYITKSPASDRSYGYNSQ